MVSGSLAQLYFPSCHGGKQGSGPDRKQSPVESGDFLTILRPGWLGLRTAWMAQRDRGRTENGRKIFPFYRTSSPIGVAAQKEEEKGNEEEEEQEE